jgi:hypothetical protein
MAQMPCRTAASAPPSGVAGPQSYRPRAGAALLTTPYGDAATGYQATEGMAKESASVKLASHGQTCHPAPMQLSQSELLRRLYFNNAYTQVARIIGYGGCEPMAFWDQVKKLGNHQSKLLSATYDLTRADRRENVKEYCWQVTHCKRR